MFKFKNCLASILLNFCMFCYRAQGLIVQELLQRDNINVSREKRERERERGKEREIEKEIERVRAQ